MSDHKEKVGEALVFLANTLNGKGISWMLGESGALMVWGVDIEPEDLDILVSRNEVIELEQIFKEYVTNPLHEYNENGKDYLEFQMKIGDIDIEIMELDFSNQGLVWLNFNGARIPVNPLEKELEHYKDRPGPKDRIPLIEKRLKELNEAGYVQIEVAPDSRSRLQTVVSELIPDELLYKSPEISYINGNVADKAHLTICYGIENSDLAEKFHRTGTKIKGHGTSTIVEVNFKAGCQDLYYSIFITPMVSDDVHKLNNWIKKNNTIAPTSRNFEPHITLCYIENKARLNIHELTEKIRQRLRWQSIQFDGVYFYKPITGERAAIS